MKVSIFPLIAAIIASATPPGYDKSQKKKGFTGNLAFLNPMNQPGGYINVSSRGFNSNARTAYRGSFSRNVKRRKNVH